MEAMSMSFGEFLVGLWLNFLPGLSHKRDNGYYSEVVGVSEVFQHRAQFNDASVAS